EQFQPPPHPYQIFGTFDFSSIMLYNSYAFSRFGPVPGGETMLSRWPTYSGPSGRWGLNSPNITGPSSHDITVVNTLYPSPANLSAAPAPAPAAAEAATLPSAAGSLYLSAPIQPPAG